VISLNTYNRSASVYMIKHIYIVLCLLAVGVLQGQADRDYQELDFTNPQTYHIAKVNVVGTESRDQNAIKSITGLRERRGSHTKYRLV